MQESQLLYGEPLLRVEYGPRGDWMRVEAMDQPEYTHNHMWQGYPGWVRRTHTRRVSALPRYDLVVSTLWAVVRSSPTPASKEILRLSVGTRLKMSTGLDGWTRVNLVDGGEGWIRSDEVWPTWRSVTRAETRKMIVARAALLLGQTYWWGGLSPAGDHGRPAGVDCSGLVHLAYRASGIGVPRDSHEQFMKSARLPDAKALEPGDLVFLGTPGPDPVINHVMLYAGDGQVIEGPATGQKVRRISLADRLALETTRQALFGTLLP